MGDKHSNSPLGNIELEETPGAKLASGRKRRSSHLSERGAATALASE